MSGEVKKKGASSTSTQSVRRKTPKTGATPQKPETSIAASGQGEVLSRPSSSPLAEVYQTEEFRNAWANDVRFHVARNFLHLRRYRRMSQDAVGRVMGTSQSAVARIESAQENITLDTLQRLIVALSGRFHISICPQEYPFQQQRPWWEAIRSTTETRWTITGFAGRRGVQTDQVLVGLERFHGLSIANTSALGASSLLVEGKTSE
jgi:transcriptional regulator with XRE-family HTH domain